MIKPPPSRHHKASRCAGTFRIAILLGILAINPPLRAADVLFIGNSYTLGTGDLAIREIGIAGLVEGMAKSRGRVIQTKAVTASGKDWAFHLAQPATSEAIGERPWNFVVLQDHSFSTMGSKLPAHVENGLAFGKIIQEKAPSAVIVLFETWARGASHAVFAGGSNTPAKMFEASRKGYAASAEKIRELGAKVLIAPVGTAFEASLNQHPEIDLYSDDFHHASAAGSYLSALVIYATLFNDNPVGVASKFPGVTIAPEIASKLQAVAAEVIESRSSDPNSTSSGKK